MGNISCTFFGHRDCPDSVVPVLFQTVEKLILQKGVCIFYVGDSGNFDRCVQQVLLRLKEKYTYIDCSVVLSALSNKYVPGNLPSVFPEGLEKVPPRFAIERRNRWMLLQAEYVVAYVRRPWGGAAKSVSSALRLGKTVIHLGSLPRSSAAQMPVPSSERAVKNTGLKPPSDEGGGKNL